MLARAAESAPLPAAVNNRKHLSHGCRGWECWVKVSLRLLLPEVSPWHVDIHFPMVLTGPFLCMLLS